MAELCKECFIATWHPDEYDIENIILSKYKDRCEGCGRLTRYVMGIKPRPEKIAKKCPFRPAAKSPADISAGSDNCIEEKCGFWCEWNKACAAVTIAACLSDMK